MDYLAEFTTSTYDAILTSTSANYSSSLNNADGKFTYSSTTSASSTYWSLRLLDSRSYSSSTSSRISTDVSVLTFTSSSIESYLTSSTQYSSSEARKGKTYSLDTYSSSASTEMDSLVFSHTGIGTTVSVSVYGNFTSQYTSFSNKGRIDTFLYWTVNRTGLINNGKSDVAYMFKTESNHGSTTSSYMTSDVESVLYTGIESSLVYTEKGSTYQLGLDCYSNNVTTSSDILMTKSHINPIGKSSSSAWTSTLTRSNLLPANSITFNGIGTTDGYSFKNGRTVGYTTSFHYSTKVDNYSASWRYITMYPIEITASMTTSTDSFIDEYVSSRRTSTVNNVFQYSLTLTITSISSTSLSITDSYSISTAFYSTFEGRDFVTTSDFMYDYVTNEVTRADTSSTYDTFIDNEFKVYTVLGYVSYNRFSSYPVYSSWCVYCTTLYNTTSYQSRTTWWSTQLSSTFYSGTFNDNKRITTTLSNYESTVYSRTSSSQNKSTTSGPTTETFGLVIETSVFETRTDIGFEQTWWTSTLTPWY